jgi:O-antigen ligase
MGDDAEAHRHTSLLNFMTHRLGYRLISSLTLFCLLFGGVALFALNSAEKAQLRGTIQAEGKEFPTPMRFADRLRFGVNTSLAQYSDADLDARLAQLAKTGVQYVRQEFRWTDIEPEKGKYNWETPDRIFKALQRHKLQALAVIVTTPPWARKSTGNPAVATIETTPPERPEEYGFFVAAFMQRYDSSGNIIAFQIWDEPNLSAAWGNGLVDPYEYHHMLRAASGIIHTLNPNAAVVTAAFAPTVENSKVNLAPQIFLQKLYELGSGEDFDVVAAKPYGFSFSPDDRRTDAQILNFSHVILMRETMLANKDISHPIWITQFGWNALPDQWQGQPSIWDRVTEQQQAEFMVRAVQRAAEEWHWLGAMFLDVLQPNEPVNHPRWGFALLDPQVQPRPLFNALPQALAQANIAVRGQSFSICNQIVAKGHHPPSVCFKPNPQVTYSEGWRFSNLGADPPQDTANNLSFRFKGDSLGLYVRRDNYRAYTYVSVDGKPANALPQDDKGAYLIMTSSDLAARDEFIEVANGLAAGEHTAVIRVDRGWNQYPLIGWGTRTIAFRQWYNMVRLLNLALIVLAMVTLLASWQRAQWQPALGRLWRGLGAHLQSTRAVATAMVTSLLFWASAGATWAQDPTTVYRNLLTPVYFALSVFTSSVFIWSPIFILSLIALGALFIIVMRRLDLGLVLLAFFIPFFIVPQRLFAYAFSMVELLTLMCTVSWGWRMLKIGMARRHKSATSVPSLNLVSPDMLDISMFAFVCVAIVSSAFAAYRVEALRELRTVIIEPALVYLILRTTPLEQKQVKYIALAYVLGALAIAGIGLFNYVNGIRFSAEFGLPRIKSIFGSPNNDALYLGRALAFCLSFVIMLLAKPTDGLVRTAKIYRQTGFWLIASLVLLIAIVLSQSRGALLFGLPVATIVLCFAIGGKWRNLGLGLSIAGAVGILVLLSGVAQPLLVNTRLEKVFDTTSGTGLFRFYLWQSAFAMWRDYPILGVGPDNFLYAYRGFYILPAAWQEPNLSHPHNFFFDLISRLGTLGLLAGVGMGVGVWQSFRATRHIERHSFLGALRLGLLGIIAYMLAHGVVDHSLFLVDLGFVFMLVCGLLKNVKA